MDTGFEINTADTRKRNRAEHTMQSFTTKPEFEHLKVIPTMPTTDTRDLNVIIHGLKEDATNSLRDPVLDELFETLSLCTTQQFKETD